SLRISGSFPPTVTPFTEHSRMSFLVQNVELLEQDTLHLLRGDPQPLASNIGVIRGPRFIREPLRHSRHNVLSDRRHRVLVQLGVLPEILPQTPTPVPVEHLAPVLGASRPARVQLGEVLRRSPHGAVTVPALDGELPQV